MAWICGFIPVNNPFADCTDSVNCPRHGKQAMDHTGLWVKMGDAVILERYHRLEPNYHVLEHYHPNYMRDVSYVLCTSMLNGTIFAWPLIHVWLAEDDSVGNCLSEDIFDFEP